MGRSGAPYSVASCRFQENTPYCCTILPMCPSASGQFLPASLGERLSLIASVAAIKPPDATPPGIRTGLQLRPNP